MLKALNFIHSKNFIHKDIHIGNVFCGTTICELNPNNFAIQYKIGDLGISKIFSQIDWYGAGTIMNGTIAPPEYLDPSFGLMTTKIDVYHVGLVLLDVITNRKNVYTITDVLSGKPQTDALAMNKLVGNVVAQALERNVNSRIANAYEFWKKLVAIGVDPTTPQAFKI
jgi:serine/threonine protein kinase